MIIPASFMIDGIALESFGNFREILDTSGLQPVLVPYALMLNGLCFRIDEQWAPAFTLPINGWTAAFATPTNGWTLAFPTPSTTWTPV